MKPKIFVTRKIPDKALEKLAQYFEMTVNPDDRVLTTEEIIEGVKNKDALLSLLTDTINASVMDAEPKLRVISNYAVGFNNIDVKAATDRKIPVCNTPGVLTETTADLTFALILSAARKMYSAEASLRAGKFNGWGPLDYLGVDVFGKTLGIIGMGRIGQAVAKRAEGFSMKIIYTSRKPLADQSRFEHVDLQTLLKESDFVSIHTALSPETTHLIGEKELALMKPSGILINTARGPIVDEKALVAALCAKRIGGAALDVFEREPKLEAGLTEAPNAVLLPHIGSATIETRTKMGMLAVENAIAIFENKAPHSCVNSEVLVR